MKPSALLRAALLCAASALPAAHAADAADAALKPPVAERQPKDVSVHGDKRIDDYFWLREKQNPKVIEHLKAENAYTDAWFKPLAPLQKTLYDEMVSHIAPDDQGVPVRDGEYWYSSRIAQGQQYSVMVRTRGDASGPKPASAEQVLVDLNELGKGKAFAGLGGMQVSPNGKLLAYSVDFTGGRHFELRVKDIASGKDLPWRKAQVSSFVWAADSRTLFYVADDATTLRANRVYRHTLGQRGADALVYEEKDPLYNVGLGTTQDKRYLVLQSGSMDTTDLRLLASSTPRAAWQQVQPRQNGVKYDVDHRKGQFFVRSNDKGANYRLVSGPAKLPLDTKWYASATEWIAHREDATLDTVVVMDEAVVAQVRGRARVGIDLYKAPSQPQRVQFAEADATARIDGGGNPMASSPFVRVMYTSMVTPPSVVDVDLASGKTTVRKVAPVPLYNASLYASERIEAKAKDGTLVPVTLVYRKDKRTPGKPQPTLLYGYGSYGIPSDPGFSSARLPLLDRGVVFALAHIRGGGDLGRTWYHAGKLASKMNTFTDFIASAEALVAGGWTRPEQLAIQGGSAGGLLVGAVTNLRPDLFAAVVAQVPFVDVINTMLDETLPLTTEEFIEWGNPKVKAQYDWMRAYSPYDNVKAAPYPAILAMTGLNDTQVPYWEPAKWVAKLRTHSTSRNPILLATEMEVGHGGASGRYAALVDRAKVAAFVLSRLKVDGAPAGGMPSP